MFGSQFWWFGPMMAVVWGLWRGNTLWQNLLHGQKKREEMPRVSLPPLGTLPPQDLNIPLHPALCKIWTPPNNAILGTKALGKGETQEPIERGSAAATPSIYLHLLPAPALLILDTNCLVNTFWHKRFSFLRREEWQRSWRPVFQLYPKLNISFSADHRKRKGLWRGWFLSSVYPSISTGW